MPCGKSEAGISTGAALRSKANGLWIVSRAGAAKGRYRRQHNSGQGKT
jgi:hypothetical protein